MTNVSGQWVRVNAPPAEGETIRWIEPIWAEPSKPRGKPDKIGEQRVIAKVLREDAVYELSVLAVENCEPASKAPLKLKTGDHIRRKETSIAKGDCHKLIEK